MILELRKSVDMILAIFLLKTKYSSTIATSNETRPNSIDISMKHTRTCK